MDELVQEFLTEATESLGLLDVQLVAFEQNPEDQELLSQIFRLVHTIKGTCGFLGLQRLASVGHAAENVLSKMRDKVLKPTPESISLILQAIDSIKQMITELAEQGQETPGDDSALINALNDVAQGKVGSPESSEKETPSSAEKAPSPQEHVPVDPLEAIFAAAPGPEEIAAQEASSSATPSEPLKKEEISEKKESVPGGGEPSVASSSAGGAAPPAPKEVTATPVVAEQSIRVHVMVLENLMNMVGELVLTRNQLMQAIRGKPENIFGSSLQRLNLVTSELQEIVMKARMQPIGNAWSKLPRIVRDLSNDLKKKINLVMKGEETELDRQVLEIIKDPLVHMVRNSADHGLESNEERALLGKPPVGTITLSAYHQGGHIIIDISDDGRGLNLEKIKEKILATGLATPEQLATMSDSKIYQHIFKAGFSTAQKVTSVSGRGVGMDVVRNNIEKIGGVIELQSTPGKGTKFSIKIPLTLAIVSALILEVGGNNFAVPQMNVVELVKVLPTSSYKIEIVNGIKFLRLRDKLFPLILLSELLKLEEAPPKESSSYLIVLLQVAEFIFGLIVDRVHDIQEIVVKPLSPVLKNIAFFSGNTILGDGQVIMILDPTAIANVMGDFLAIYPEGEKQKKEVKTDAQKVSLMVFKTSSEGYKVVPLALVARLEELESNTFEKVNDQWVVQYRGTLMPLINLGDKDAQKDPRQKVLVFSESNCSIGVMVEEIVEIVEQELIIDLSSKKEGTLGTAIIQGKTSEILDTSYYLTQSFPDWFHVNNPLHTSSEIAHKLLLIDDSSFFRNLLNPLLKSYGYDVTAVDNPKKALELRDQGYIYDLIISDIEMPEMNGFEFMEAVRAEETWKDVPIIALSSRDTPEFLEKAKISGFNDYVIKLNRELLLTTIQKHLKISQEKSA